MKKLMIAAVLACSMCVCAADAAPAKEPAPAKSATEQVARPKGPARQRLTPEQRKAFHERMQAARKARQAEILAKVTDVLKEAGLTDEQAKTAADKIEKIYTEGRRGPRGMGPRGLRGARPEAAKPVADKPAAAK